MKKKPFEGKVRTIRRLKQLIPPLEDEQRKLLEQSLIEEGGAYNPLWLWGDALVDGHHRLSICKRKGLPYKTIQVYESANTIEEVEYRMKRDAIAQRNLPPSTQSKFRAEMVAFQIAAGRQVQEAVRAVAEESGVSERQVYRDVERTNLVEQVDETVREAADLMSVPKLKKLASISTKAQRAAAKRAAGDKKKLMEEVEKEIDPEDAAKKIKNVANQHRDKLVRSIDAYHHCKKNPRERARLVEVAQSIELW